LLWATNHRQSKHLLLQLVLERRSRAAVIPAASRGPFSWLPRSWGPEGAPPGSQPGTAPAIPSHGYARPQAPNTRIRASILRLLGPGRGVRGCIKGLFRHPQTLWGQEPESRPHTPSLPGFHPVSQGQPRRSLRPGCDAPLSPACAFAAAALTPGPLRGASPVRPSHGEAGAPSAPRRLPREGARPPPRLHPLRGAAAIWGPCQSRPLRGPHRARAGGGSPWRGPRPLHRAVPSERRCGEPRAEMPRGGGGREPSLGGRAPQRKRAPLATSVTLREPGLEPRRRR
jgi:hypothetical protein